MCVVDEYGNIRSVDYDGPEPIMTVSFQKPKITVQTTPEIDEEENAEECKDNSRSSTSSLGKKASKRKRGEKDNNDRCFFSSFFVSFVTADRFFCFFSSFALSRFKKLRG